MNKPYFDAKPTPMTAIHVPTCGSVADPAHFIRYVVLPGGSLGGRMYHGSKISRFLIKLLIWSVKRDEKLVAGRI